MIKIAVVEDQKKWEDTIKEYFSKYSQEHKILFDVSYFNDGITFSHIEDNFDLVFMDIGLPKQNGIETAKILRKKDANVCIVFLTELIQFAVEGYEVHAYDYLVKPMNYSFFSMKFDHILKYVSSLKGNSFNIEVSSTSMKKVLFKDIYFLESDKHYVYFHCKDEIYRMRSTLDQLQEKFVSEGFCKINRSIMVNLAHVENYSHTDVVVNNESLPLSRVYKSDFLNSLTIHLGRNA